MGYWGCNPTYNWEGAHLVQALFLGVITPYFKGLKLYIFKCLSQKVESKGHSMHPMVIKSSDTNKIAMLGDMPLSCQWCHGNRRV